MGAGQQTGTDPDKLNLRPPGARPDRDDAHPTGYRWVWIGLTGLVLLGLAVIFVLPQRVSVDQVAPPQEQPVASIPVPTQPAPRETSADARPRAEQALQQFLQLRAELELSNAAVWGEPLWSEASAGASAGDRLFGERRFADAAGAYTDALQELKTLVDDRPRRLAEALDAGQEALSNNDVEAALNHYELALAIEPGHQLATQGLDRARVRTELLERMAAAEGAERDGNLEAAQAAYLAATQLDSEYQPAIKKLEQVSRQLTERDFRAAMSRALRALDAGQLGGSGRALAEAARLKPGDAAVSDAQQRLASARQQAQLASLRRRALDAMEQENWQGVAEFYRKALAVDAGAAFARTGLAQANDRRRLHEQFDHYLSDPGRLSSPEPLANAERLLSATGRAPGDEPRLAEKIRLLKAKVAVARVPLPVRLQSDGETEVVIYHVGRLGRFLDHQLELRPGIYTAVGSRPGYRDVRREFTVSPGQPPPSVDIRCEEPV